MGNVFIEGVVTGPTGKQANVRFLVDSGAIYTLLPDEVWRAIELKSGLESVQVRPSADAGSVGMICDGVVKV